MSAKEMAHSVIDGLSEEKVNAFLLLFADENTLARLETEAMASSPDSLRFNDVDDLLEELES